MNNYVSSVIRTWVPVGVGLAITWLAKNFEVIIDEESTTTVIAAFTTAATGIYYAVVRKLEATFPQIGWLLGLAKSPGYEAGTPPQHAPGPSPDEG